MVSMAATYPLIVVGRCLSKSYPLGYHAPSSIHQNHGTDRHPALRAKVEQECGPIAERCLVHACAHYREGWCYGIICVSAWRSLLLYFVR